jgi:hypothetical protein
MIATRAWNCSPIYGTDVEHIVSAMGRAFKLPFDVALDANGGPPVEPLSNSSASVLTYIQQTSAHINFASQAVKLVVDNRGSAHCNCVHEGCSAPDFSPSNLVLIGVQVISKAKLRCVAKLSYQVCGPFHVILHAAGSYKLVLIHKPATNQLSYPGHMLSPISPVILPYTPVDSPGFQYLNQGHAPLPNPLKHHLNIEQYNKVWFYKDSLQADHPCYPDCTIQPDLLLDLLDQSPFPSLTSIDVLPTVDSQPAFPPTSPFSQSSLTTSITSSSDCLFSISSTPASTLWH